MVFYKREPEVVQVRHVQHVDESHRMKESASKYIEPLFFLGLLIFIFVLQWYSWIFPFRDFSWLAFFHHDLIYQVERFLLNLNYAGIEMLNSGYADYGSELWLLIPFFKVYELFLSDPKPIHAYYFLTVFHLLCGISSFIVIRFLFKRYTGNSAGAILFILIVMSSPIFVQYFSFIKPDPNVVLLCILLSLSATCLFYDTANRRWLFAALIVAALGTAIKWWSAFMLFPIAYTVMLKDKEIEGELLNLKYTFWAVIGSFGVLYIVQHLAVRNAIAVLIENSEPIFNPAFINGLPALKKRAYETVLFLNQKSGIVVSLVLALAGAVVYCVVANFLFHLKRRFSQRNERHYISGDYLFQFVRLFPVFTIFFLLFDLPFLISNQLVHSVYDFSQSLNLGLRGSASTRNIGFLLNAREWIDNLITNNLLSFFTVSGVFFSIYAYFKKLKRDKGKFVAQALWTYLIFLISFLFLFVTRKAAAVQAMIFALMVFFMLFNLSCFLNYLSGYRKNIFIALVLLFSLSQIIWQNARSLSPSAYSLYTYRYAFADSVKDLNMQLLNTMNKGNQLGKDKLLLFCQRDFPIYSSGIKARRLEFKVCRNPENLMAASGTGDLILFTDAQRNEQYKDTVNSLLTLEKMTPAATIAGKRYRLEGNIEDYNAYLYRIN